MGILSNMISREELRAGDHIYAYRRGHTFSHHGIYVGKDLVIHFTSTNDPISSSSSREPPCEKCRHDPNTKRGVLRTCIKCFLKGHHLLRFEYEVSRLHSYPSIKEFTVLSVAIQTRKLYVVPPRFSTKIRFMGRGLVTTTCLITTAKTLPVIAKEARP
ncbi:PREDICTED: NC [Prunus dulcis]|uniref:PREDICTED: NC n=1 Tax=Prunus dulcis TaxID=3755 RepID=A0A5E4GFZ1_PRUDU|nr:PREDICTED: NC [Prunus dulcis]